MTDLQSVCSHGHKLQFGDVQQAFNTGDLIKRGQPLFVRMPPDGIPGESREVWVQAAQEGQWTWSMTQENGGMASSRQPEVLV